MRAVYGEPHDHVAHGQWLEQLRAVGDLGPLGRLIGAIESLLGLAASGVFQGVSAAARRVPWPWLVVGAVAAAGAFRYFVAPETRQQVQTRLGAGLASVGATVMEVMNAREAARRQFEPLLPAQPDWNEVVACRGTEAALTRASLYHLARSPQSDLSASELAATLRLTDGFPRGEAKVRAALRRERAFNEPYRGRFQVGAPAVPCQRRPHGGRRVRASRNSGSVTGRLEPKAVGDLFPSMARRTEPARKTWDGHEPVDGC